jgi:hypothetical protein
MKIVGNLSLLTSAPTMAAPTISKHALNQGEPHLEGPG